MKPSLDVNSMKEFCIQHVEKFVFGGVVLLLLLFAVRAVGNLHGVGLDFSPDDLKGLADSARKHLGETDPKAYLEAKGIEIHPYGPQSREILEPIPLPPLVHEVIWNEPLRPPRRKREQPALMAIEDLRAAAGHGAVPATGGMAAGQDAGPMMVSARTAIGRRWVVVTGIIDSQAQLEAYKTQFEDAVVRDWQRDMPLYLGYRIEKAEVTGDEDEEQLKSLWKPITLRDAFKAAGYTPTGPDPVDTRYFPPQDQEALYPMVFPLPPLIRREFGPEVAHYPEIPLAIDMPESERGSPYGRQPGAQTAPGKEGELPGAPGTEKAGETQTDEFAGQMGRGGQLGGRGSLGMPGGMPGMPGGMPGMPGGMPGMPGGGYPGMEESAMGYDGGMPGGGSGYPYGAGLRTGPGMQTAKPIVHQLFRFFDFDVKPGKRYRYRVKPVLKNPNFGLPEQYVIAEKLSENRYIEPDGWSDPSETVAVPYDSRLVAGPVKAPATIFHEPSADVVTVTLRMEDGFEASKDYTVYRGHLANFEAVVEEKKAGPMGFMGPEGMESSAMGMPPGPGGPEPKRRKAGDDEEEKKIEHATNMLVLDIAGGDRLHRSDRSLTEPGYLLLMGPDGSLVVRDELHDQDDYLAYHVEEKPREKRKEPGPEGMMPGMEEGMMMEEDMYGLGGAEGSGRGGRGRRPRR